MKWNLSTSATTSSLHLVQHSAGDEWMALVVPLCILCVCVHACVRVCLCASEWGVDASGLFAITAFKTKEQQHQRQQRINTRHRRRCCERETQVFLPCICIHVYIEAVCFLFVFFNCSTLYLQFATCAYLCKHNTIRRWYSLSSKCSWGGFIWRSNRNRN